jgi:hypothetical protein
MKFENSEFINTNGTNFRGKLEDNMTYARLCEVFGDPTFEGDDMDNITKQWSLEFEDSTIATIYNWHKGESYSVGGFSPKAFELVEDMLYHAPLRMSDLRPHEIEEYNAYLDDTAFNSLGYAHED